MSRDQWMKYNALFVGSTTKQRGSIWRGKKLIHTLTNGDHTPSSLSAVWLSSAVYSLTRAQTCCSPFPSSFSTPGLVSWGALGFSQVGLCCKLSFQNIKCERKSIAQTLKQFRRKTNHGSWHHFDQLRAWGLYDTPQSIVSTLDSLKKGKVTWTLYFLPPTLIQCIAINACVSTRKGKWRVHVEPQSTLHTIICRGSISQRLWSKKMLTTRMAAK